MSTAPPGEDYNNEDEGIIPMTPGVQIPAAIGLAILILISITGNSMTVIAYLRDQRLCTVYDFYLFQLGITDLLLSAISLPFYTVYTLMEFTWPFGYAFCKIYLVCDFTMCFQSIMLMLIISLDRLLLIQMGHSYMIKITRRVGVAQVVCAWLISFLVFSPAIIGWDAWVGYSTVKNMDCDVEFAYDRVFTTITAFVEFLIPFVCMTSLNALIYVKIKQRSKVNPVTSIHVQSASSINPGNRTGIANALPPAARDPGGRHRKAAKFLAMLVVAFLIFWAPYSITTVLISFCDDCVNTSLYEFFNFFLWMKSAVNPFLYAYNSPRYRMHFRRFLTFNGRLLLRTKEPSVEPEITVQTSAM
ncbi:muscarinic acetylcholine receptor M1-like [Dreissena polymorpha]|uniref:G-protein coupled receptors family 1 profile domain-containing protein n=1 Tax=Dreissena polymorpha TaxID=45954 RepID=A0A9D4QTF7_DREPO|nr:muscarinic acetylcholine receptor M1-like [Dreissena polymorpha]KAH3841620.1 hypothetical protein DPMN_115092 [Dreissena polymorpha]